MSKDEETRAIENSKPRMVVREELGGDYYYKCPWLTCGMIVKSEWMYCPLCGQHLRFPNDYEG